MKSIRVAGLVEMEGGFALMHRMNVKPTPGNSNKPYGEYYVFPGGGLEKTDASLEDGAKREILEECGIEVEVKEKIAYVEINENKEEYLFYCTYKSGEFGNGTGPEFNGDPRYKDRGTYIPEIVEKEKIRNIRLIPENFKKEIIKKFSL